MIRRLFGLPPKHRHQWDYCGRCMGGWGVVRCLTCGYVDLY
jgi:hypothetical protein